MKKRTAKPRDWSDTEKRQLVKLVRDGISTRAIAAALGRRANSVRMMAREMKLILRKKARRPPVRAASGGG
jgi:transposase